MSKLRDKLLAKGSIKNASVMSESKFFGERDSIRTDLPVLNIALSGDLDGGITPGLTIVAGASKSFKTSVSLFALRAYFKKYPDAVCLYYDNEFGSPPAYLETFGIDLDRVIHIPIQHIEEAKFDMTKRLEEVERGDKVFIFFDSIGNLASKKEIDDAMEEKAVADMTRAKAVRSMLRIVTPQLTIKDIPMYMIAHTYKTQEMYSKDVIGSGTAVMYSANTAIIISRSQDKTKDGLEGYFFNMKIEKSRFVKEQSIVSLSVKFDLGINPYSGLMDLALEMGIVLKPSNGWYCKVDMETGEMGQKMRLADTDTADFWNPILENPAFKKFVREKYQLGASGKVIQFEENEEEFDE